MSLAQVASRAMARRDSRAQARNKEKRRLDRLMARFAATLQRATGLRWLRPPSSPIARACVALLLIAGGTVGFLPILGYWMIPLGVLLLAQDVPMLRRPVTSLMLRTERRWRRWRRRRSSSG